MYQITPGRISGHEVSGYSSRLKGCGLKHAEL